MIDGLAFEPQFLDHLAPVWSALSPRIRGTLKVDAGLVARTVDKGLAADVVDGQGVRASSGPPDANPGPGPVALTVSIGDIKVGRRLGYRKFVFMEHGAGQAYLGDRDPFRHPSYAGGADREDVGLFLVPNEYSANLWRRYYDVPVEVVGCPRLDRLPDRVPDGKVTVAISFHWPGFVAPESDTALGHYLEALAPLAKEFNVIGHAHPKGDWPRRMERLYRRAGIPFVADFDDVCRQADVYVCDNSSTLFEFAATGRPVVVLNGPQYRRNVYHGLRFWEAANVGIQVDQPADLNDAVLQAIADGPEQQARREASLNVVYAYRTGGAERAAAAIANWME